LQPPVDPILIHFTSDFGIHWYGVLIITGILLGANYASWRARRDGEDPDHVWNGLIAALLLGIVVARLFHVGVEHGGGMQGWSYYRQHPIEILLVWKGGLSIYGAIVGGALGVLFYAWYAKLRPLQWLDYGAPGLAMGQVIGRWGNFINQELYGPPTNSSWGLLIDPAHRISPYNNLTVYPPDTLFHPTFLYESLWCLLLSVTLVVIARKFKDRLLEGDVLLGYVIGYPLGRFFIEYFRPDSYVIGPVTIAQLVAIVCVIGGTAILVVRHARARGQTDSTEPVAEEAEAGPESSIEPTLETASE
jgi:phosphatidylglycerol:prolipoprotein diacylglycerol transferase